MDACQDVYLDPTLGGNGPDDASNFHYPHHTEKITVMAPRPVVSDLVNLWLAEEAHNSNRYNDFDPCLRLLMRDYYEAVGSLPSEVGSLKEPYLRGTTLRAVWSRIS